MKAKRRPRRGGDAAQAVELSAAARASAEAINEESVFGAPIEKKSPAPAAPQLPSALGAQERQPWQIGSLSSVSEQWIVGWAWDPSKPDDPVIVEVLEGDRVIYTVLADKYGDDLKKAGIGNGKHAFVIPNPSVLFPLSRHLVNVRRAGDSVNLPGSPKWLLRPGVGLDSALVHLIEEATNVTVATAKKADELDQLLSLNLRLLNALVNRKAEIEGQPTTVLDPRLQELLNEADISSWLRELFAKIEVQYAPIALPAAQNPLVSIVIPVYNKFSVTYACIKSISEHLPKASFEIIIVDDCSKDETLLAGMTGLVFSGGIRVIRNDKNKGFVLSCNAGAALAKGKYLFFLNNDTLVRPGWLDELVATFEDIPNVGIAGSRLFFENGTLQESGGLIWRMGDGWNWGRNADAKDPRFTYLRDADYVSGAALMIERETFEKLNGFDEYYAPAYYEDTDLCFRVRAMGKRVVVQPASEIVHLEGVSAGTDVKGSGMKRFQLINHKKFFERWKDTLSTHRFNGEQPELEAERLVKKRAYFIDETVPTPDQDAGSNAALQHMLALTRLGYKVTFIPADNMARIDPYTARLEKLGIECVYAPHYWSVEEVFRKTGLAPDVVYLHRYKNASKYANLVRLHFPKAFTIYNVADLHFLRQKREEQIEGKVKDAAISERAEIGAMKQVDSIIVHSSAEAEILRERDSSLRVHVVPWTFLPKPTTQSFKKRAGFAFVGGYGHRPNIDAALFLAREVLPSLRKSNPAITGYLVGSKPPPEITTLECENLHVLGFVPDLTSLLHRLRCTVAPLRYGAGLKGKVVDSLAHGIPCVMSEIAAEGLDLPEELSWLVATSAGEIASKLRELHDDEALNKQMAERGLRFVRENFSEDKVDRFIREAIAAPTQ